MDKEITLALLTPRSGELNYRYLIPEGVSYSDMKLGEIRNQLERSEKDRPGVLFQCEARQLGGRMGTEALIFHVPDFQRYPQDEQKRCRELLKDWFDNERDSIIQAIDWSAHPNTQTIAIPELTQLKNQLNAILTRPQTIESQSGFFPSKISFIFKYLLFIMIALIVTILLISFPGIQNGDVFPKFRPNLFGGSSVQEQEEKLFEKLTPYKELFQFPTEPTKSADYLKAFDDLYRYCEQQPLNPVDKYLQEEYVKSIKQQKQAKQIPVFGRVPETRMLNNVKGISPVQLRRILAAYKKMQEALSDLKHEPDNPAFSYDKFVRIAHLSTDKAKIFLNPNDKIAQPMFFVQSGSAKELEWAMTIHDFINFVLMDEYKSLNSNYLSNLSLLGLIQDTAFEKSSYQDRIKSDELRSAFDEFYSVLKEIANETNADKTKN